MKYKLSILILFFSNNLLAQSNCDCFDRLYNLSFNYKLHNNKEMAFAAFKDAISFINDSNQIGEYYAQLAETFLYFNETDSALTYFSKGIKYGSSFSDYDLVKENYPEIFVKMDTGLLKGYDLKFKSHIDINLYRRYKEARDLDLSIREDNALENIVKKIMDIKTGFDSKTGNNWKKIYNKEIIGKGENEKQLEKLPDSTKQIIIEKIYSLVDSVNFIFINDIFSKYGFPDKNKIGFNIRYTTFALHIIPYNNERSKRFLYILDSLNKTCDYPEKSGILVFMEKKKYCLEKKSQCGLWAGNMNKLYMEIEDISKADNIRFLYNYVRIKEAAKPTDPVPKEYKPTPYPKDYFCLKKYHFD